MSRTLSLTTVMPFFYPATQMGGPVVQAYIVGKELVRRGHTVQIVTTDIGQPGETPRDRWVEVEGMRVWYGRTNAWNRVVPYWEPQLRQPLEEILPATDVIQLRMGLTLQSELVRRIAKRTNTPYVYNAEGALCPTRLQTKRWSKWLFLRMYERRILREAAALQAVTAVEQRDLISAGADPARVHLIPNGVAMPGAANVPSAGDFHKRWKLPPDARIVLFLGRVSRLKGIEPLVRGFASIADANPDTHLVIAGPGDGEGQRLVKIVAELQLTSRVHLVGTVPGRECWQAFAESELFALTSFTEGLPNAVLEALTAGLPVLISHACNVPEVAVYEAGRVIEPTADATAIALKELLGDVTLRQRMSQNAQRLIAERFALSKVVDQLEALYRDLAVVRR